MEKRETSNELANTGSQAYSKMKLFGQRSKEATSPTYENQARCKVNNVSRVFYRNNLNKRRMKRL